MIEVVMNKQPQKQVNKLQSVLLELIESHRREYLNLGVGHDEANALAMESKEVKQIQQAILNLNMCNTNFSFSIRQNKCE